MKNGLIVDKKGTMLYYLNNLLHRVDGPAVEYTNGDKLFYIKGEIHRVNEPAIEWVNGSNFWWLNNKRHRVDGPAEEWADGEKWWYLYGKLHRVDGPAIEYINGTKRWYLYDKEIVCPKEFKNMEVFITKLNNDQEYSLPFINDINGIIEVIKNPTDKQKRLHAIKWKI